MTSHSADSQEPLDKGKRRAKDPTERTPLLFNGTSQASYYDERTAVAQEVSTRRLRSWLTVVFLTSLALCILLFVAAALLAWTYASKISTSSPEDIVQNALVSHGPESVDIINVTSTGEIWVKVEARLGVDAGSVIGVNSDTHQDGFLRRTWKSLGRWGVGRLEQVTVSLSAIDIVSGVEPSIILTSIEAQLITLPLTTNPPSDGSWLTPVSTILLVQPTNDTGVLLRFMRKSWRQGSLDLRVDVGRASIRGGSLEESSWRSKLHKELFNVRTLVRVEIPSLPGLPPPGDNLPFPSVSDLVTLTSFNVFSQTNKLILRASATVIDPAPPEIIMTTPSIPFVVSLPSISNPLSSIPVASVSTAPFSLTHPNITLDISGHALPLATKSAGALSSFLTRYLSGESNPILISSPLISNLSIDTVFPAPNPRPQVLQDVTIRNMKIKPGTPFLASGTVSARIVLPKGINIDLNVSRLFPDVLIFDGEVPDSEPGTVPPPTPLPDPLPERAFGHIRPDEWLPASCESEVPREGEGAVFAVAANIVDAPLEVLPGRQKAFSDFVRKVIFSSGAIAGIQGVVAVSVKVNGLRHDGEIELHGLPVKGRVPVGKKTLLTLEMTWQRLKRILGFVVHSSEETEETWTLLSH
ncbi:hypothetical protein L208DRAFT_1388954 [Tricholoma matsutake]|nr:hypothetical protein L208DRAFT_1388954 [Tricholoma matsutake 945]